MTERLSILSAGAARPVVRALAGPFERDSGFAIDASFDSAGATRARVLAGEPCDLFVLPQAMQDSVAQLVRAGDGSIAVLGGAPTCLAAPVDAIVPPVGIDAWLPTLLTQASALYCPDTARATAGIHFLHVLRSLGLLDALSARLRPYPNGALAMAALAQAGASERAHALGCTQATEILDTPGVTLIAPLPAPFSLTTVYSVAVRASSSHADAALRFLDRLTGDDSRGLRRAAGFV